MKLVRTTEAAGHVLCHDMTRITPGAGHETPFRKGHTVTDEDIPVLLSMGKESLYIWEASPGALHENEGAARLLALCGKEHMTATEPKEGKIEVTAACDGLFLADAERLRAVNSGEDVIIATRHGGGAVRAGDRLAGMRVIPLVIEEEKIRAAEKAAGSEPLLKILPFVKKTAAIVATGSELTKGLIQDHFTPVVEKKLTDYGIQVIYASRAEDDLEKEIAEIAKARASGAEIILCTGGMSVDPDDRTPAAIRGSGAEIVRYGAPVLPGAMLLVGYYDDGVLVLGLPGCVMHAPATIFDLILPRAAAGVKITREDIAGLGHGGLCLRCESCHYPVCPFGKCI